MLWSNRYITLDNNHACANYKSITHLHNQGTDELVVEALHNMLQLVGSLENLAGLGPPPGSDYLIGTRGGIPLQRATSRMTSDGHVRIMRVRGNSAWGQKYAREYELCVESCAYGLCSTQPNICVQHLLTLGTAGNSWI